MILIGSEYLANLVEQVEFSAKAVLNAQGVIFFPVSEQHRDQTATGVSYEDEYKGNALAAMLAPGKIEIRYHEQFSDEGVRQIVATLLAEPELAVMRGWQVTYQGRTLEPLDKP